jgi:hypothetical protein
VQRPAWKKGEAVESWTIIGFISLQSSHPIFWKAVQKTSNSTIYTNFVVDEVVPFLHSGQTIFVDNLNYHVSGILFHSFTDLISMALYCILSQENPHFLSKKQLQTVELLTSAFLLIRRNLILSKRFGHF